MIRFICPSCRQTLEVSREHAGRQARCSRCGQLTTVPATPLPAAGAAAPLARPPAPGQGPTPGVRPNTTNQLTCPGCGQWLEVDEAQAGKLIRCGGCGQTMQAPLASGPFAGLSPLAPATAESDRDLTYRLLVPLAVGGLLGVLLGASLGVNAGGSSGLGLTILGVILGGGAGAVFVMLWAFRLGALPRSKPWVLIGATVGAILGAAALSEDGVRGLALAGAVGGALVGTAAGLIFGIVWRQLEAGENRPRSGDR